MIDHLLGRPSRRFRKVQVLTVLLFWTVYLLRGNPHGPPLFFLRPLSRLLSRRLTSFQTVTLTLLYLYVSRNFAKILNLESPEPLANLYSRSYFRATWVMTALDAGFWTAMRIRTKWLRELCSVVFSGYYLLAAERADEKVRRVRASITVDHLRVSWNKSTTPYLKALSSLLHPKPNRFHPRHIRIPRPKESIYKAPVNAYLYFEGTREELRACTKLILDFPGGGFVAMSPKHHDDKLLAWAYQTRLPIIAVDYKKAPEFPYPYALNECYDVYHSIIYTKGRCIGFSGDVLPRIAISGDSAGGNFAAGVTLMILNSTSTSSTGHLMEEGCKGLPLPEGLVLIYPSLDLNIGSWMSDEQMKLIRRREERNINRRVVHQKSTDFEKALGNEPGDNEESESDNSPGKSETEADSNLDVEAGIVGKVVEAAHSGEAGQKSKHISTKLAMTSRLSYFNDRILTPEMMRAMVILYIGPHNRPDFTTDYFLSPICAPESLLAQFPKTYFLTGERDPLVDDTVIMAGRIRAAKRAVWKSRYELGLVRGEDERNVEVRLVEGISHGFLQMAALWPGAHGEIGRCGGWLGAILADREPVEEAVLEGETTSCSEEEMPLEMRALSKKTRARGNGGDGRGRGGEGSRTQRQTARRKRRGSAVSLGSEVDLVGRRMQGLAGGLLGADEEVDM
ncbi:hypothetical protein RUND412_009472 [Rhizina undulata]